MLHFASGSSNGGGSSAHPRRADSLNATQHKTPSHPIFLTIEQELHDARRVGTHGQEDDLRGALNMVINRVTELSALLSEVYKSKAELEVQLNVAKSNLQLVIANNEMLEEALKSGNGRDVGWRRSSGANAIHNANSSGHPAERPISHDSYAPGRTGAANTNGSNSANSSPTDPPGNARFFKTLFTRPGTPTTPQLHLTSPSLPSLHGAAEDESLVAALHAARASAEQARQEAERERKAAEQERKVAEKARALVAAAQRDKAALEEEIETLSQALFEEANKMVATERKRRAAAEGELEKLRPLTEELRRTRSELRGAQETREELQEVMQEKEALRRALRLIEGENVELRSASRMSFTGSQSSVDTSPKLMTRSRSSSEIGTKSPVRSHEASPQLSSAAPSPRLAQLLPSFSQATWSSKEGEREDEEPITFAQTRLRAETSDTDEEARPTPRRDALRLLRTDSDVHNSRTSSPALSPPPTATLPAPDDPWAST
ncbi:hypothetical protein GGX14DRAFT_581896 [Mycena pura]|uniref:GDP/GTP exchange factor Sec2 N-terminal domain-containing protein n=1 Tax=Mycena pura TaxID=153505 RepID=A0AAD6YUH1_9AGAR|nr:hypothetical protein GGX14DRAFT_581896 [Mycena pura]